MAAMLTPAWPRRRLTMPLAAMLALDAGYEAAMRAANAAAAVVVGKPGTATVSVDELRHRLLPAAATAPEDKIIYDRTTIGDRVRTSVDTTLVAPVTLGDDSYTGAGSVITDDIPAGGLGMELPTANLLRSNYDRAVSWGWQDKDWSAIGEVPYRKAGL